MREDSPGLFDLPVSSQTHGRFEAARLTQARVRIGVSKTDLADEVRVSAAAIGQYEAGVNSPRPDVLDRLAKALQVHPGFFGAGRPLARIETVNAHFRSLRSARVSDRHRALAMATLIWELTFALERYVKLPKADLPNVKVGTAPAEAAVILRKHWNLPDGPVRHLVATAESRGIVVAVRPLGEIEAVDAFSVVIVDRPIIITTPRRSGNVFRHRFSIAHEIGHLLLHADSDEHSVAVEKAADEFAAALLTPGSSMDAALPQRLDLIALDRLGRTWGVSPHSLVRRMVERGRTTESSARRAYQRLTMVDDPTADITSTYPGEVPTLLTKAAALAADHGAAMPALAEALRISPREIRDLLGEDDHRPVLRLVRNELSPNYGPPNSQKLTHTGDPMANKRIVQKRDDGNWEVRQPGSDRASAVVDTQADGIGRAREILGNAGGGELQIRGLNGQIRSQDTITPGNDPRSSEG